MLIRHSLVILVVPILLPQCAQSQNSWTIPIPIDPNPYMYSSLPTMATTSDGSIYVVTSHYDNNNPRFVTMKSTDRGNTWSKRVFLGRAADDIYMAVAPNGTIWLATITWNSLDPYAPGFLDLWSSADSGLSYAHVYSAEEDVFGPFQPAIAADSAGNIYLLWQSYTSGEKLTLTKFQNGNPDLRTDTPISDTAWQAVYRGSLLTDRQGRIIVGWDRGSTNSIMCSVSNDAGVTFASPTVCDTTLARYSASSPDAAIDTAGNLYVVYETSYPGYKDTVRFVKSIDRGLTFSTPSVVGPGRLSDFEWGNICVDTHNRVHVRATGNPDRWFMSTDAGTTFSSPGPIPQATGTLTSGIGGNVYALIELDSLYFTRLDIPLSVAKQPYSATLTSLYPNYPNPFNPATMIKFEVRKTSEIRLEVFDVLGREVSVLLSAVKPPGYYELRFDASALSSGVYYCRLKADKYIETMKMLLLR